MTGRTGACAAALGFYAWHRVAHGILHHSGALIDIQIEARAVEGNDSQFGHDAFRYYMKREDRNFSSNKSDGQSTSTAFTVSFHI
jgi:hypothetical protein